MFKKLLSIILCAVLVLSIAGCGQGVSNTTDGSADTSGAASQEVSTNETEADTTASAQVEVDENLLTVELTLPASYFGDQDMSVFDTDTYAEENGFISASVNEDGSLSILMTKGKQKELLNEMAAAINSMIEGYTTSEDTAYIKEITYNEDYTSFTLKVDPEGYANDYGVTSVSLTLSAAFYHMYAGIDAGVEVIVIDANTGETISTSEY